MEEDIGWGAIPADLVARVLRFLERDRKWRHMWLRLRFVSKHWKSVVDEYRFRLSIKRLPDFPVCGKLGTILKEKKVTALHVFPQEGSLFRVRCLGDVTKLSSLREVRLSKMDNGDDVLFGMLPLAEALRRMEVRFVRMTQCGLYTIAHFRNLEKLKLIEILNSSDRMLDYQHFGRMEHLTHLTLVKQKHFPDLQFLIHLSKLQSLELETAVSHVENLQAFSTLTELTSLSMMMENVVGLDSLIGSNLNNAVQVKIGTKSVSSLSSWFHDNPSLQTIILCEGGRSLVVGPKDCNCLSLREIAREYPLSFWRRRFCRHFCVCVFQRSPTVSRMLKITSLDLSGRYVSVHELKMLGRQLPSLREMLLHHVDLYVSLNKPNGEQQASCFSSLECLTISLSLPFTSFLAEMPWPVLQHIGILFDSLRADIVSALKLASFPSLHEISFAAGELVSDCSFWTAFSDVLLDCKHLKKVGWRSDMNTDGMRSLIGRQNLRNKGILIDEDISVFFR